MKSRRNIQQEGLTDNNCASSLLFLPFLAGTQDRIVLLSGDPDTVTHALSLVIEHLHSNAQARASMSLGGMGSERGGGNNNLNGSNNGVVVFGGMAGGKMAPSLPLPPQQGGQGEVMGGGTTSVKLLIAKGAGGLVIGRGGATIKVCALRCCCRSRSDTVCVCVCVWGCNEGVSALGWYAYVCLGGVGCDSRDA